MNTIPPNNVDQLIAWIRIFAQQVSLQIDTLSSDLKEIKKIMGDKE